MLKEFLKKERFLIAGIVSCLCFVACMFVCATKPNADFSTEKVIDSESLGYDAIARGYVISNKQDTQLEMKASNNYMDSIHLNLMYEELSGKHDVKVSIKDEKGNVLGEQTLTANDRYENTYFKIDFETLTKSKGDQYTILITPDEKMEKGESIVFRPQVFAGYEIIQYRPFLFIICSLYAMLFALYIIYCIRKNKKDCEYSDNVLAWSICQLIMLFFIAIVFARQYAYGFWDLHIIAVQFLVTFLMLVFNGIWMIQMQKEKIPLYKVYLILGMVVGLSFDFIIPIGLTPDDVQHIYSSYYVASVLMGKQDDHQMVQCRQNESEYEIKTILSRKHSNEYYASMLESTPKNVKYVDGMYSTDDLYNPHWTATMSALGIIIGRLLHMNAFWTLMLGRLFNTIIFVLATAYAIKIIPFGKSVIFAVAFLPMVQQQVNSYSHDNLIMSASILIFAIGLYWCSGERQLRIPDVILYVLAVFVLSRVKGGTYAIFALIPVLFNCKDVQYKQLLKKYRWLIVLGCVAIVCMMFWGQISGIFVQNDTRTVGGEGNYLVWADAYSYSLSELLHKPKTLVGILINTFLDRFDFYFASMISSEMGWLEFTLPTYVLVLNLLIVVFAICADSDVKTNFLKTREILIGAFLAIVTFGLCAAGLLLDYTPNTSMVIEGVQGRYFLPGALLICIVLTGLKSIRIEDKAKGKLPVMIALVMFINYFSIINCFTF